MNYKRVGQDIFYSEQEIVTVGPKQIKFLLDEADKSPRQQSRLCTHESERDNVHEMLIVHKKDMYVRPHQHIEKIESFYLVQGDVDIVLFDGTGRVVDVINLGDYQSGKTFYFRFNCAVFHTVIINSPVAIFHEVTKGPFIRAENDYADWAPAIDNLEQIKVYQEWLNTEVNQFKEKSLT